MNANIYDNRVILVTGSAGFIGFHVVKALLDLRIPVVGIDNINSYYDISLKKARLNKLYEKSNNNSIPFENHQIDISHLNDLEAIFDGKRSSIEYFKKNRPTEVVNLAAQAGVRYSIENPSAYIKSNINGFLNILECAKKFKIKHLVYASSSSVYGGNTKLPFKEEDSVDHPVSIYAATKKANELMAHSYSHLYNLPSTGLRFFTVYGPWGRPDMALFLFTKAIIEGKPIKVFNNGEMIRDFTYIDDIIKSMVAVINKIPIPDKKFNTKAPIPNSSWSPYRVFNIGNSNPIKLMTYINALEDELGKKTKKIMMPIQPGDVKATIADTSNLEKWIKFKPNTSIERGIHEFVKWYKLFYKC